MARAICDWKVTVVKDIADKEKIPGTDAGDLFFAGGHADGGRRAGD
ncbi:hypothetical protein [Pseudarthrobacter sp. SSS035]|nr:hypothetical protein [Pseudarthrobacter sp. SSS035]